MTTTLPIDGARNNFKDNTDEVNALRNPPMNPPLFSSSPRLPLPVDLDPPASSSSVGAVDRVEEEVLFLDGSLSFVC